MVIAAPTTPGYGSQLVAEAGFRLAAPSRRRGGDASWRLAARTERINLLPGRPKTAAGLEPFEGSAAERLRPVTPPMARRGTAAEPRRLLALLSRRRVGVNETFGPSRMRHRATVASGGRHDATVYRLKKESPKAERERTVDSFRLMVPDQPPFSRWPPGRLTDWLSPGSCPRSPRLPLRQLSVHISPRRGSDSRPGTPRRRTTAAADVTRPAYDRPATGAVPPPGRDRQRD